MINSKILISVVIVLMIGVAAAGYQISQTPQLWELTTPQSSDSSSQDSQSSSSSDVVQGQSSGSSSSVSSQGSSGGSSVKVSSSEAKKIAEGYIQQDGAVAGTPVIKTMGGKKVYVVPVKMNGENVGAIYIDANTGENLGGEGGAP
jgi:uncharacterized membrane protein YkoI